MNIFKIIDDRKYDEYMRFIRDIDNINIADSTSQSLLHRSIVSGDIRITKDLIFRGIDPDIQSDSGSTALHFSATYKRLKQAEIILEENSNVNIIDNHGNNPLWTAFLLTEQGAFLDLVDLFIKYGADMYNKNNYGRSVISLAKEMKGDIDYYSILMKLNKKYN